MVKDSPDNLLLIVAVIAVIVSAVGLFLVNQKPEVKLGPSGKANLSILENLQVNFTRDLIQWGTGIVSITEPTNFDTLAGTASHDTRTPTGPNFTDVAYGFIVENTGNRNVTFDLQAGKTAFDFVGGTGPAYFFTARPCNSTHQSGNGAKICNASLIVSDNDIGSSCVKDPAFPALGIYTPTSTTPVGVCDQFGFQPGHDELRIDINLSVPSDAITGVELQDTLTAVFGAA